MLVYISPINTESKMEREDGEMSDDNAMLVDDVEVPIEAPGEDCTMVFKPEKTGLVVQKLEKVDAAKLDERARRFGLNLTGKRIITQKQIDELYDNCGIESGSERHVRFDTIHLHGTDGLTTNEIFEYLEDYKPLSLEQIDYISCNVVCQDHISAALALLAHSCEIKDPNLSAMISDKNNHHWREGVPHPKKDMILMRYATNSDKKLRKNKSEKQKFEDTDSTTKNPWGDLCKSWGVYDHQEVFEYRNPRNNDANDEDEEDVERIPPIKSSRLAARLGKRVYVRKNSDDSGQDSSDSEWKTKSKIPRMRMHADDEEKKQKKNSLMRISSLECKDEYAPLSIQVANSESNYVKREATKLSDKFKYHMSEPKPSIQLRLGDKLYNSDSNSSDEVSAYFSYNFRSQVQKVQDHTKSASSVWSRLDRNTSPQKHNDLRKLITSKKKNDDLRDRIGKSKKENLRIEIDNTS